MIHVLVAGVIFELADNIAAGFNGDMDRRFERTMADGTSASNNVPFIVQSADQFTFLHDPSLRRRLRRSRGGNFKLHHYPELSVHSQSFCFTS
ncbi:MAG: hypothetical protein WCC87_06975 [Candidatus Korobacteraceae bacterium]